MPTTRPRREEPHRAASAAAGLAGPIGQGGALGRAILAAHLLLSPVVFSRESVEVFEYNKVNLLFLAAIAIAALRIADLVRRGGFADVAAFARGALRDPVALGFLAFFGSALVSTVFSISPWTSIFGCHESFSGIFTVLSYVVLFFGTRWLVQSADDARRLLLATAVGAAVASTYALIQVVQIDPIRWGRVSTIGSFVRPFATMGHPNFLSAFLVMAFPATALFLLRAANRRSWGALAVFFFVAVFSLVAIAVSVSRGAWLAFVFAWAALVLGFSWAGERRGAAGLFALPAIGLAVLVFLRLFAPGGEDMVASLRQRVHDLTKSASRMHIWAATWSMVKDHPILGCGLDAYQLAFEQKRTVEYWIVEWNGTPTKAHNEALHILATQGALGAAALLLMTAGIAIAAARALRRAAHGERPLLVAIAAGTIGFFVQDFFSFTVAGCGTLFVTFAAVLSSLGRRDERGAPEAAPPAERPRALAAALVAAGLAGAVVFFLNVAETPGREPEGGSGRALAGIAMILSFALPIAGGLALERAEAARPPFFRPLEALPGGALLRTGAVWLGALLLAWLGVYRPMEANWECRNGMEATADAAHWASFDPGWLAARGLDPEKPKKFWEEGIAAYKRAAEIDGTKELYWVRLGTGLHEASRYAADADLRRRWLLEGRRAVEESIRLIPANSYNHANLARLLADLAREGLARTDEVYAAWDRAIALDRNNAYFYCDAASAALALGDLARAKQYAATGAALYAPRTIDRGNGPERYPGYGPPYAKLGLVAWLEKRPQDAAALLLRALDMEWRGDEGGFLLAASTLSRELARPADALEACRRAAEREPDFLAARVAAAEALEELGRREEAIAELKAVLDRQPSNEAAIAALRRLKSPRRAERGKDEGPLGQ
jgi:O-antigen ligase/tetratricopeptide (TPR) repeat protein